jgi:lipid-binding SYLF domain-containing protein
MQNQARETIVEAEMALHLSRRTVTAGIAGAALLIALSVGPQARGDDVTSARHIIEETVITVERVREEIKHSPDLDDLLRQSKGVLVIPSYYKASFIFGGAYGDGVLLARLPEGGFGDPAFYRLTAGSVGLQAGIQSAAIVFMILTEKGLSALLNDEFKLGANVGIALGSIGVGAEAATTTLLGKDIVAYSTNTGLFAGGSFEGAVIRPREDWNAAVYGVDNDDPRAVVQRDQLRTARTLKDVLDSTALRAEALVQ